MQSRAKTAQAELLASATDAALEGARVARAHQLAGLSPRQKSGDRDDLVTQGDVAAQEAILARLPRAHEGEPIGVLAEEKTGPDPAVENLRWRWVVDPIDGTLPYSKGEAFWCVSVALQEKTTDWESRIAVVYQASPEDTAQTLRGRLFYAEPGKGAFVRELASGATRPLARPGTILPRAEFSATGTFAAQARQEFNKRGIATQFRRSICHATCEMLLGLQCAVVQDAGPLEWDVAAIVTIAREAQVHVHSLRTDCPGGVNRYEVVMAWDEGLFQEIRARLARPEA